MESVNLKNEGNNANTLLSAVVKTHLVMWWHRSTKAE